MNSRRHKSTLAALAAVGLLAFPAAAGSAVDYSKNAATGDYAHGPLPPAELTTPETPSVNVVPIAADESGFDWGDAAIGAGVTLALALLALATTVIIRRRRIASPAT
jgi:hypothetical protein